MNYTHFANLELLCEWICCGQAHQSDSIHRKSTYEVIGCAVNWMRLKNQPRRLLNDTNQTDESLTHSVRGSAVALANGVYISARHRECLYIDWWIAHSLCEWYIYKDNELVSEWMCFVYSWETRTRFYPSKRNSSADGSMGITIYFCVSCFFSAFINCVYSWETKTRVYPFKRVLVVPMRPSTKQIYICVSDLFSAFISHIPNTNEICPTYIQFRPTYERVMSPIWLSHVPRMDTTCIYTKRHVVLEKKIGRFSDLAGTLESIALWYKAFHCAIFRESWAQIICLFSWTGAWST